MRGFLAALWMLSFLLLHAAPVSGAGDVSAEMAFGGGKGEWELLLVKVKGMSGGEMVGLRDGRGGMRVWRAVESGGGGGAESGSGRALLPLPVVAAGELAERWAVEVSVRAATGEVSSDLVEVKRAGGAVMLRVIGTEGAEGLAALSAGAVGFLAVSEEEVLAGPPATFLACDAVAISDRLAGRLSADRIAALLGTGVRLVTRSDPAAMPGVMGRLRWEQVSPGMWLTRRSAYPRGKVVEPGMERVAPLSEPGKPGRATIAGATLAPVAAVVVLMLAFGLFRRRWLVTVAFAAGMAGVTAGSIWYLLGSAVPQEKTVTWVSSDVADAGATTVAVREQFTATSALFGQQVRVIAQQDQLLIPASVSVWQYFRMRGAELFLDVLSEDGLRRESRLEMPLRSRRILVYATRTSSLAPGEVNTAHGAWIEGGYVTPTSVDSSDLTGGAPMLLTRWAKTSPGIRDSLLAWFEMGRFQADHRYFLSQGEEVRVADFGETVSVTPPP